MISSLPFFVPPDLDPTWDGQISAAYHRIDTVLNHVGAIIRWRFNLAGQDAIFKDNRLLVTTDDRRQYDLQAMAHVVMGDDRSLIHGGELMEVAALATSDAREPLPHQLLREAWNLHYRNPRGSLVIGVAAAEVGLKQLIAILVPYSRWLVEELPLPPLVSMMKNYLPELPIRAQVERNRRCPKHLRTALDAAVTERNAVVHRGIDPSVNLRQTLIAVREFLYLLDLYAGQAWAASHLSEETIAALDFKG